MTTDLPELPPPGRPPWMTWVAIGCAGCLTVSLVFIGLGGFAVWQFWRKNMKVERIDVSGKPDLPLTATAGQLVPQHVGSFTRTSLGRPTSTSTGAAAKSGWQGVYVSAGKRVTLVVTPTAARAQPTPLGGAQQPENPNTAIHMSMHARGRTVDMVIWSKPQWTFMVESPDMVAVPFAREYRPAAGNGK